MSTISGCIGFDPSEGTASEPATGNNSANNMLHRVRPVGGYCKMFIPPFRMYVNIGSHRVRPVGGYCKITVLSHHSISGAGCIGFDPSEGTARASTGSKTTWKPGA